MPPSLVNRLCGKPSGNSKQFVGTGRKWRHTLQLTGALCKDTYRITTAPIKSTAPVKKTLKMSDNTDKCLCISTSTVKCWSHCNNKRQHFLGWKIRDSSTLWAKINHPVKQLTQWSQTSTKMAYPSIPAPSFPSQDVFSTAEDIVIAQWSQLLPENVDMLIVLKKIIIRS